MNFLMNLLQVVQILAAIGMTGLILVQHGKGADAGAAFGGGAGSASLFGASGGANFLSRMTAGLAGVFLVCTLGLAYFGNSLPKSQSGSVLERAAPAAQVPADQASTAAAAKPAESANSGKAAEQIPGK